MGSDDTCERWEGIEKRTQLLNGAGGQYVNWRWLKAIMEARAVSF